MPELEAAIKEIESTVAILRRSSCERWVARLEQLLADLRVGNDFIQKQALFQIGELCQATWGDFHLDADVPFVVVRDCVAKNKKEESVPLVPEIVEALTAHRPAGCTATDLVFPHGIPRARRLTLDLEANGIPYRDELGRYGDFHALRYTWATFLQRNGVAQRFAMKLLRHSDIKLTAKVYTDEMQLPIYDAIKNLPRLDAVPGYTQIHAQILGVEGQNGPHPDANSGGSNIHETIVNSGVCHGSAEPVASCQVERVKGIESCLKIFIIR
jgi:integrase